MVWYKNKFVAMVGIYQTIILYAVLLLNDFDFGTFIFFLFTVKYWLSYEKECVCFLPISHMLRGHNWVHSVHRL